MNLEDEGKFPVEKDFQDSLNVFYVNEVFISLIRRDGLRGLSKIEKIFDHFTLHDDLRYSGVRNACRIIVTHAVLAVVQSVA